ncbi:MAG: hypothetical protein ACUVQ0_06400 [Thermoproteota archaeon]
MKHRILLLLILLLMASNTPILVKPQLDYLTGLNMEVELREGGIARVTLKQHPFDRAGNSLISNMNVVGEIIEEEELTVNLILLFFTTNPSKASYRILSPSKLDYSDNVLCNTGTPGAMTSLRGAIVLTVEILLNTTGSLMRLEDDVFRVILADYFTLTSPESWLDIMDIRLAGGVRLLNFSVDPPWAKPPSNRSETRLLWVNTNEADSPDNYVLTLKIPGVVLSRPVRRLSAELLEPVFSRAGSSLKVRMRNTGSEEGAFTVVFSEPGFEQARKIMLGPGESGGVVFPVHVQEGSEALVRILGDGVALVEKRIVLSDYSEGFTTLRVIGVVLVAAGLSAILLHFASLRKKPPPSTTPSVSETQATSSFQPSEIT